VIEQAVNSITSPTDYTTEPICMHDASNDANSPKEGPFRGLSNEKFLMGNILPQKFQRTFYMQIKKVK
jgi:hypothetical protein